MNRKRKEKQDIPKQAYTRVTLLIQIFMTVVAAMFIAPILIIINYSFINHLI